jgi:plastocyanin
MLASTGALTIGVSLAGCGGDSGGGGGNGGAGGGGNVVDMPSELVYDPDTLTVSVGDTVTWENTGSIGHSVTAYEDEIPDDAEYFASGGFDSEQAARDAYTPGDTEAGDIPAGESWEHTFETAGTHEYFCIPHEQAGMVGTIEVEE